MIVIKMTVDFYQAYEWNELKVETVVILVILSHYIFDYDQDHVIFTLTVPSLPLCNAGKISLTDPPEIIAASACCHLGFPAFNNCSLLIPIQNSKFFCENNHRTV